jgi:hypothetical protein
MPSRFTPRVCKPFLVARVAIFARRWCLGCSKRSSHTRFVFDFVFFSQAKAIMITVPSQPAAGWSAIKPIQINTHL